MLTGINHAEVDLVCAIALLSAVGQVRRIKRGQVVSQSKKGCRGHLQGSDPQGRCSPVRDQTDSGL